MAEAAKARSTGFPHYQTSLQKPADVYVHGRGDDTISKQSPLACRELLSACRGAVANHRAALQLPGMLYRGSQNSWLLAARGGSHHRTCGFAGLAMASLCAASLSVVDGYSTLLLAQLRSNVVIPRRAAAGPHCRTAGRPKCTSDALRCSVNGAASRQTMAGGAMTALASAQRGMRSVSTPCCVSTCRYQPNSSATSR